MSLRPRAWITGATRGIGRAITEECLRSGMDVFLTARSGAALDATGRELSEQFPGREVLTRVCDHTSPEQIAESVFWISARWPKLKHLVLNVGSGKSEPGWNVGPEEWRRVLEVNLISSVETLRQAVPLLATGDGASPTGGASVVFIGSIASREWMKAPVAYAAAKAAQLAAMKSMAWLLAPEGIRVNAVSPGNISFPGGRWEELERSKPENVQDLLEREVPMKRFGTPLEVACAVRFLLSEEASFMTGEAIVCDGGQSRTYS